MARPPLLLPTDLDRDNFCIERTHYADPTLRRNICDWAIRFFDGLGDDTIEWVHKKIDKLPPDADDEQQYECWIGITR